MKKSRLLGAVCAFLFILLTTTVNASFVGVLPATPGDTDYQAYYDDQLNITWLAETFASSQTWTDAKTLASNFTIDGIDGWRLPNMDLNGDETIVDCSTATTVDCLDNEFGYMYWKNGVTPSSPNPFW